MKKRQEKLSALLQEMKDRLWDLSIPNYDHTALGKIRMIHKEYAELKGDSEIFLQRFGEKVDEYLETIEKSNSLKVAEKEYRKQRLISSLETTFKDFREIREIIDQKVKVLVA